MKNLSAAIVAFTVFFCGLSGASAQRVECDPEVAHAHLRTSIASCGAGGVDFSCNCACDTGYHTRDGAAPSATNACVRDAPDYGTYRDPLCGYGSVRERGVCTCPESLGRDQRILGMVEASRVRALQVDGTIENAEFDIEDGHQVAVWACHDPLASRAAHPELVLGTREALRILCAAPEAATDEQLRASCTETRALIDSIGPRTTIVYDGRNWTLNEFTNGVIIPRLIEIENRLSALEGRVTALETRAGDHERRISALEAFLRALRTLADVTHLRLGGAVQFGGLADGALTVAGGISGELIIRFGDLPVGAYGRVLFGGQSTGWDVGNSMYISGGGGLTFFAGGRADTTVNLGVWGETLYDPYTANSRFPHDSLGIALGGQGLISIPLPGDAHIVRVEAGLMLGLAERRLVDAQGEYRTPTGFYVSGTLGLVFQPDW